MWMITTLPVMVLDEGLFGPHGPRYRNRMQVRLGSCFLCARVPPILGLLEPTSHPEERVAPCAVRSR
jgi:hypothetical protein